MSSLVATILLACGVWTLVRTGGFTASFKNDLAWRWSKTPEERLLTQERHETATRPAAPTDILSASVRGQSSKRRSPGWGSSQSVRASRGLKIRDC